VSGRIGKSGKIEAGISIRLPHSDQGTCGTPAVGTELKTDLNFLSIFFNTVSILHVGLQRGIGPPGFPSIPALSPAPVQRFAGSRAGNRVT
jgi:hypothetical protein